MKNRKENSQDGNGKKNNVLNYKLTNKVTELNELIYAGAEFICEDIWIPSKITKKKSEPGWEIRRETHIKILRKHVKMIKHWKNTETWREKRKRQHKKIKIQLEEIKQKVLAKEGRLKSFRQRLKQYRHNWKFQNSDRKQVEGDDTKTYQHLDVKKNWKYLDKIWQPKEHKKAKCISKMTKQLGLDEGRITTLQNYLIIKRHDMM